MKLVIAQMQHESNTFSPTHLRCRATGLRRRIARPAWCHGGRGPHRRGEGTLLERIRAIAPNVPIAVQLDLHANVTDRMMRNCTVIAGYKTYPHVDGYEAAELAGRILLRYLQGEVVPVMAWGNRPLLAHTLRENTSEGVMRDFVEAARAAERAGMLAASAFAGFQHADIHDAGVSAVVVADRDRAAARRACDAIFDGAWRQKEDFVDRGRPLDQALFAKGAVLCDGVASPDWTQFTYRNVRRPIYPLDDR